MFTKCKEANTPDQNKRGLVVCVFSPPNLTHLSAHFVQPIEPHQILRIPPHRQHIVASHLLVLGLAPALAFYPTGEAA